MINPQIVTHTHTDRLRFTHWLTTLAMSANICCVIHLHRVCSQAWCKQSIYSAVCHMASPIMTPELSWRRCREMVSEKNGAKDRCSGKQMGKKNIWTKKEKMIIWQLAFCTIGVKGEYWPLAIQYIRYNDGWEEVQNGNHAEWIRDNGWRECETGEAGDIEMVTLGCLKLKY